jgi:hypothetical protein
MEKIIDRYKVTIDGMHDAYVERTFKGVEYGATGISFEDNGTIENDYGKSHLVADSTYKKILEWLDSKGF